MRSNGEHNNYERGVRGEFPFRGVQLNAHLQQQQSPMNKISDGELKEQRRTKTVSTIHTQGLPLLLRF